MATYLDNYLENNFIQLLSIVFPMVNKKTVSELIAKTYYIRTGQHVTHANRLYATPATKNVRIEPKYKSHTVFDLTDHPMVCNGMLLYMK